MLPEAISSAAADACRRFAFRLISSPLMLFDADADAFRRDIFFSLLLRLPFAAAERAMMSL